MIAKLGKELPERVIALSKSVIECSDKGSDCATKIKATTKKHSHANKRENTFTFIFPYLFHVFFSYPKRYLLVSRNRLWRSQFSKRNVCLSFTAFEERRGFDHSRVQFDDIVFSSAIKYSNSGSKRFRNMVYKYRNVGQLVALESKLIRAPRMRRIWLNRG